ncbi:MULTISPECIES: hypothetical protein [Paracoccaceae]|uniref:hypothetical protein n=1 Tax=Paracoccaceae TaxID=31989 RepID=UPI0015742F68|nr:MULTISPECIES: hypothetical protein [Paracoccaceae]MBJ2153540.1 hypothetical protein [Paracoccus sp. IB05]NTT88302.1 hypothetical protein [Tabrizicola sp. SY72]
MISIERTTDAAALACYAVATVYDLGGAAKVTRHERERELAIQFFTNPANYFNNQKLASKSFAFKVYKDKELAKVLSREFCKKCAYCESKFAAVTASDIEHYRPKSSVGLGATELKPGYYWLGGDWDNLLISCPDCNRVRTHEVPGQSKGIVLGKGTQFPLTDETRRVRSHNQNISTEDDARLLLNPCIDKPEDHLTFDETGLVHAICNGVASQKGKISIDVYALQRKDLVEARLDEVNELRSKVEDLQRLVRQHNTLSSLGSATYHARADNLDHIAKVLNGIKAMMLPSAEYVAAKRSWLRVAQQRGEFDTIRKFGIKLEVFQSLAAQPTA